MQVELFEQFLFDTGADTITEERAVRYDDPCPSRRRRAFELAHDELQEEQGGFGGLFIWRKVFKNAVFFFTAERGIGQDDIDALAITDFAYSDVEAVAQGDLRGF